jgi:hypothetical protein
VALVECGLCGWSWTLDEDREEHEILSEAAVAYARHMWNDHPDLARTDPIAVEYIRARAAHQARTS